MHILAVLLKWHLRRFFHDQRERTTMKIAIGTKNPAKVEAVQTALASWEDCSFTDLSVPSEVSAQPFTDKETIQGAINRATNALEKGNAEIGIGLEGGVLETDYGMFLCNWGALVTKGNAPIIAGGARILLPHEFAVKVRGGMELGHVMDELLHTSDLSKREGAIGVFTNNWVGRKEMFVHIVKLLAGQYDYERGE